MTTKKVVIERKKQEQSLENGMGSSTVVNGVSKSWLGNSTDQSMSKLKQSPANK